MQWSVLHDARHYRPEPCCVYVLTALESANVHPGARSGRLFAGTSLLGPPFMVSTLPDAVLSPSPDVRQQYFADIDSRRPTEISSAVQSLRLTTGQIAGMLHTMVKSLLGKARPLSTAVRAVSGFMDLSPARIGFTAAPRIMCSDGVAVKDDFDTATERSRSRTLWAQDTREPMMAWFAAALESNSERNKTIVNEKVAAPDGFFANLNAVLLALCQPFLEPSSDLAWRRIDVRCFLPARRKGQ